MGFGLGVFYQTAPMQQVAYGGQLSAPRPVRLGVRQGSVQGPVLFIIYTGELTRVVASNHLNLHHYADDCHTYSATPPSRSTDAANKLACWLSYRRLLVDGRPSIAPQPDKDPGHVARVQTAAGKVANKDMDVLSTSVHALDSTQSGRHSGQPAHHASTLHTSPCYVRLDFISTPAAPTRCLFVIV